jgi:hypothetical protein
MDANAKVDYLFHVAVCSNRCGVTSASVTRHLETVDYNSRMLRRITRRHIPQALTHLRRVDLRVANGTHLDRITSHAAAVKAKKSTTILPTRV